MAKQKAKTFQKQLAQSQINLAAKGKPSNRGSGSETKKEQSRSKDMQAIKSHYYAKNSAGDAVVKRPKETSPSGGTRYQKGLENKGLQKKVNSDVNWGVNYDTQEKFFNEFFATHPDDNIDPHWSGSAAEAEKIYNNSLEAERIWQNSKKTATAGVQPIKALAQNKADAGKETQVNKAFKANQKKYRSGANAVARSERLD